MSSSTAPAAGAPIRPLRRAARLRPDAGRRWLADRRDQHRAVRLSRAAHLDDPHLSRPTTSS
jgi:hypothetical protein